MIYFISTVKKKVTQQRNCNTKNVGQMLENLFIKENYLKLQLNNVDNGISFHE